MKKYILLLLAFISVQFSYAQYTVTTGTNQYTLMETAMSANIPYSPTAYCDQDGLRSSNSKLIIVNNHNTLVYPDAMSIADYNDWFSAYITGLPTATFNRIPYMSSPSMQRPDWPAAIAALPITPSYQLTMTISKSGQNLKVFLRGKALAALTGDYRFNVLILEDSVEYDQLSNGSQVGPCPYLTGASMLMDFKHRDVMRAALGGSWGMVKVSNPAIGKEDTMTFNYTIPASYDAQKMKVVGVVQKYGASFADRPIVNAISAKVSCINNLGTVTGPTSVCAGKTITVSNAVTGGTWASLRGKFSITASGAITANTAGMDSIIYSLPNTCSSKPDTLYSAITIDPKAVATQPSNGTATVGGSKQFAVTSSSTTATYKWQTSTGANFQDVVDAGQYSGATTATLNVSGITMANNNQSFRCIVTGGNCTDTSSGALLYVFPAGVQSVSKNNISISPNPASNVITINADEKIGHVEIFNMVGQKVFSQQYNSDNVSLDISGFAKGVYIIKVNDSYMQKLGKE